MTAACAAWRRGPHNAGMPTDSPPSPDTTAAPRGLRYAEVCRGDRYRRSLSITPQHLDDGARLIGDFNPLHVDEDFARASRFGGRILHGVITSALMGAELGMVFSGTALGYLQHDARFLAPVRIGDRLDITWTVVALEDKPRHDGGIVSCDGEALNQRGERVCVAHGRMLVGAGAARAS